MFLLGQPAGRSPDTFEWKESADFSYLFIPDVSNSLTSFAIGVVQCTSRCFEAFSVITGTLENNTSGKYPSLGPVVSTPKAKLAC